MKKLNNFISEASLLNSRATVMGEIDIPNYRKTHGFVMFDDASGTISVIQYNKIEELVKEYGTYEDFFDPLDKLKEGESVDIDGNYYMKVW